MTLKNEPNFFILGAAKAGTTALYDILSQHPDIYFSFVKETMFFSHDDNFQRGFDWYVKTFFSGSDELPLRGEATPHYLYWAEKVAPRIAQQYSDKDPKFIVILRDPVKRAYSWYWNMKKEGKEDLDFEHALAAEALRLSENKEKLYFAGAMTYGYLRGSDYLNQIKEYLKYFSRDQFFFLLQEDLNCLDSEPFTGLIDFLGVQSKFKFQNIFSNQAKTPRSRLMHQVLHDRSIVKELIKKVLPLNYRYKIKTKLSDANMQEFSYPPLDKNLEIQIRHNFLTWIPELESLIGRDLSAWKI